MVIFQTAHPSQVGKQLPSRHILQHKVQVLTVLAESLHVDNKRMVDHTKYLVLVENVVHLFSLHNIYLLEHLNSRELVLNKLVFGQPYSSERPSTNSIENFVVVDTHLLRQRFAYLNH